MKEHKMIFQRVKMLKTQLGANDGSLDVTSFLEGKEYSIGPSLLHCFIDLGIVEMVEEKAVYPAAENKAEAPAVENKAESPAQNKKRRK